VLDIATTNGENSFLVFARVVLCGCARTLRSCMRVCAQVRIMRTRPLCARLERCRGSHFGLRMRLAS
jgi:hypothetical protein